MVKAAMFRGPKTELTIEDIQLDKPGPREILVKTVACGVCHSDLHFVDGLYPMAAPAVLGHEPAGIVEEVGSQVTYVKPGDHVIACLSVFCGVCEYCMSGRPSLCQSPDTKRKPGEPSRLSQNGEPVHQGLNLAAYADKMLLHENAVVKIRDDMPLDRASLIGCGVTTGLGAALNTVHIPAGASVVIIGCGGVGLSALQGARIVGAGKIIAVDAHAWKFDLAQKLGATHCIDARAGDPVAAVQALTGGGADFVFECIGLVPTVQQAIAMTGRGGTAVLVGVVPIQHLVPFSAADLTLQEKKITGSYMGSNRFRFDMPKYIDFYLDGRLRLDEMISSRIPLGEVNDAFDRMRKGEAARQVIVFD